MVKKLDSRVQILNGMREFVGKTGVVVGHEKLGRQTFNRVRLDEPVEVSGVGLVKDDLWESNCLKTLRK